MRHLDHLKAIRESKTKMEVHCKANPKDSAALTKKKKIMLKKRRLEIFDILS
jgi:hypothetical protein